MHAFKKELLQLCEQEIQHKLQTVHKTIKAIQEALQHETKSSAGDKHETGRAMLHIEREKAGNQLANLQNQLRILNKISRTNQHTQVGLGSLVYTNQAIYFIALSLGERTLYNQQVFIISLNTPIGQLLHGKKVNDTLTWRGTPIQINNIL